MSSISPDVAEQLRGQYTHLYHAYRSYVADETVRGSQQWGEAYNQALAKQLGAWQRQGMRVGKNGVEQFCAELADRVDRLADLDFAGEQRLDGHRILNAILSMEFLTRALQRENPSSASAALRPNFTLSCEGLISTTYLSISECQRLTEIFGNNIRKVNEGMLLSLIQLNLAMPVSGKKAAQVERIGRQEAYDTALVALDYPHGAPRHKRWLFRLRHILRHFRLNSI